MNDTVIQIKSVIRRHDDSEISDAEAVDLMKRLYEQHEREHRDMNIVERVKHNGILHKAHLYTDLAIGLFALVGLAALVLGFEEVIEAFFQIDLWFHIVVIALTFGMIAAERILHRHRHSGVIGN